MNEFEKQDTYQATEVKRMKAAYERCQLTRREFMQGLIAVGLTATTATAILTGSRDVRAEIPKKGGRIKVAFTQHGPTDTLDPTLVTDSISYARGRAHQNRLVQFNDDITVRGDLAETFEVNSDATEFTFHLRKDVTFHDGKDFTADDVIYTMNRHLGEDSVSKAKTLVGMISEWKKLDKHTVKAILSNPNADLLPILATFHFSIVQDGADEIPSHFQKVNGTGPFTVEEFQPGVRSSRNATRTISVTPISTRLKCSVSATSSRGSMPWPRVTSIWRKNLTPRPSNRSRRLEGINLLSVVSGGYVDFVLMQDRSPGDNPDFVMAIKLLQNRVRMVRSLMKGHGGLGNDHPVGPAYGADHCETLAQQEFDPDQAKFHLKKSGITEAQIHGSEGISGGMDSALMLQAEGKKLGLKIDLKKVPYDGYWGSTWMQTPFHQSNWNARPTAYVMMELAYAPDAPWNESQWKNERMGQLLESARAETDRAKRKQMLCDMQELISNEAGTPLPFHTNYVDAVHERVKGIPGVPLEHFGGGEWPEYAWIDS